MTFSSLTFLFIFLPITLIIYFTVPTRHKNLVLFLASLAFYMWCEPIYIVVLLFIIIVNYGSGLLMSSKSIEKRMRKLFFILTISVNVAVFIIFKYQIFLLNPQNLSNFFSTANLLPLAAPLGISIYILQALSYTIDLYLNKIKVQRNFVNFAMFVSFFPQIICGPIVRYSDIKNELHNREETTNKFAKGYGMFIRGLAKKIFLADTMLAVWHGVSFLDTSTLSLTTAWLALFAYAFAAYFYFSGYSDMARGIAKVLGFEIPINFNYPYVSKSIVEFWRRWNISLTVWFKAYIFTPLWKNNNSFFVNMFKLLAIWVMMSFWYGGKVTFVLWGIYLGVLIILEKLFLSSILEKLPKIFQRFYTMFFVAIGWVIFSANTPEQIPVFLNALFMQNPVPVLDDTAIFILQNNYLYFILCIITCSNFFHNMELKYEHNKPIFATWFKNSIEILLFIVCIIHCISSPSTSTSFFFYF